MLVKVTSESNFTVSAVTTILFEWTNCWLSFLKIVEEIDHVRVEIHHVEVGQDLIIHTVVCLSMIDTSNEGFMGESLIN